MRDQLKAGLSASAHASGSEPGPSVSELAEKIKALKAANSIEGTPQRARQKHSTAEEPITARIRRRAEANPVSERDSETQDVAHEPKMTFQQRIALERQLKDQAPSLA